MIIVMFFSVVGFGFSGSVSQSGGTLKYGDYEFFPQNNFWVLTLGGYQFGFINNPTEMDALEIQSDVLLNGLNSYAGRPLYVSSEDGDATSHISLNLGQVVQRIQNACLDGGECEGELPIKDCTNNFIILLQGESNKITQDQNCIYLEAKSGSSIAVIDEFLFKTIGVR